MALQDTLKEKWEGLTDRERVLLSAMGGVMAFLLVFVIIVTITRSFDERQAEIEQYRQGLYYLEDNLAGYAEDKREKDKLRDKLLNNDMAVGDFLRRTASGVGIPAIDVSPGEERDAATDGGGGALVTEYEVTIKTVERDNLLEFLWKIDQLDAPVYIRRLAVRRNRGGQATGPDTPLTVSMTVVSYKIES